MDGNGRWAKKRFLPRFAGHQAGLETVRRLVKYCAQENIEVLTLFAFSSENWRRPQEEVSLLMQLFITALQREVQKLHKNNVKLRVIGAREAFPNQLQEYIAQAEQLTAQNTGLTLVIAANYGGRWDITQAAQRMAREIQQGTLQVEALNEQQFTQYLCLADLPEPDLFIRTGGEQRVSNFLLWQLAYTEMYFTDTLWPDFDQAAFQQALHSFSTRQRRFGRTGEQLEKNA
jgi:undecaprenyl diphosphate synthase